MRTQISIALASSALFFACSEDTPVSTTSSSAIAQSSATLSSSSAVLSSSAALSSSSTNSGTAQGTVLFDAGQVDQWGAFGTSGILAPDGDFGSGGSSAVLGADQTRLGGCASTDLSCTPLWDVSSALSGGALDAYLKVTAWVPSSASGWGWASAGWAWIPKTSGKPGDGQTWFDMAQVAGFKTTDTLVIDMEYVAGKALTLEPGSAEIKTAIVDANNAPPRATLTGTGARKTYEIALSNIKPASWSKVKTYDITQYNSLRLMRLVAASTLGQPFPSSEESLRLKIYSIRVK